MFDHFYIDFYMRLLNYFRQNITNPHKLYNEDNTDINSTLIYYLIENNLNDIFDKKLNVNETTLRNFMRTEYQKPLCNIDIDLSDYILKNVLDDFETLIRDSIYQKNSNHDLFLYSLYFGVSYLIYKFESSLTFEKKAFKRNEIFNKIGINEYKQNTSNISQDKILKKYLKFRHEYSKKNIDQIEDELNLYRTNDFYIPSYILKLS
jgi:hypothetical protein